MKSATDSGRMEIRPAAEDCRLPRSRTRIGFNTIPIAFASIPGATSAGTISVFSTDME